jgi:hypothetical protein
MCFLLLLGSELLFDSDLEILFVVHLPSDKIGSWCFQVLADLLG